MNITILYISLFLITGISMLLLAWNTYGRYQYLTTQFTDRFKPITVFKDVQTSSSDTGIYQLKNARYKVQYIYNSTCYQIHVSRQKYNETFYICEDHPEKVYSESDLVSAGKNLVLAGIECSAAISFFAAVIMVSIHI